MQESFILEYHREFILLQVLLTHNNYSVLIM